VQYVDVSLILISAALLKLAIFYVSNTKKSGSPASLLDVLRPASGQGGEIDATEQAPSNFTTESPANFPAIDYA
jgi:hypothetical protein